jgi:hypothetical protein
LCAVGIFEPFGYPSRTPEKLSGPSLIMEVTELTREPPSHRYQKSYGTVSGRVVDQNGNAVAGTNVQIKSSLESAIQELQSDEDGRFDFDRVPPGPFLLTTTGEGFVTQTLSHTLRPGEGYVVPPMTMFLAAVVTEVRVSPSIEAISRCSSPESLFRSW